jgi:hypothetical protein
MPGNVADVGTPIRPSTTTTTALRIAVASSLLSAVVALLITALDSSNQHRYAVLKAHGRTVLATVTGRNPGQHGGPVSRSRSWETRLRR